MPYKRSDIQRFRRNQLLGCSIVVLLILSLLYFAGLFGSDSSDVYNSAFAEITALANKKQSGPLLIRLAWHDAGTYDKATNTGGPRGTIRFPTELSHAANAGLSIAIAMLEPIKQRYPSISYADFYALAGVAAIRALDGPRVAFHPGRIDDPPELVAPEGRLPDGANGEPQHLRTVFGRMGFNDREIVALSGAHSVGRMHKDRSGFEGQWTPSPLLFNNEYFQLLLTRTWEADDNAKPRSFSDGKGNTMMPSDMALVKDEAFRAIVLEFAEDDELWKAEFSLAFQKLIELGWAKGSLQPRVL